MVTTDVNTVTYNGNGSNTAFPFTFKIQDASEINLQLEYADGTVTDITSDYYVDTVNSTVHYPGYAPGSEPAEADQPAPVQTGQKLTIWRDVPMTQENDLGDKWPFKEIEDGLDKLTMICQQIYSYTNRKLDAALNEMFQLAGIVTDSGKLQHITDQYNAIDANAAAAAESEENAAASATAAASSATSAAGSATSATNTANALVSFLESKETLTAPAVDPTLTISGAATDAKVTGDKINELKEITTVPYYVSSKLSPTFASGAININGVEIASATYQHTEIINVSEGDVIKENGTNSMRYVTAYYNGNVVPSLGKESVREYVVPYGVDSIIITLFSAYVTTTFLRKFSLSLINALQGQVDGIAEDVSTILIKDVSENIFDGTWINGETVSQSTGEFVANASMARTDYIKVAAGNAYIGILVPTAPSTVFQVLGFYDINKNFYKIIPYTGITVEIAGNLYYQTIDVPEDGYIVFTILNGSINNQYYTSQTLPTNYVEYVDDIYINPALLPEVATSEIIESMTYGITPEQVKKSNFINGETLTVESNSIMKNQNITFFAKVTTMGTLYIGHGKGSYGYYIGINNTSMMYMSNGSVGTTISHGLTITDFIFVNIQIDPMLNIKVTIVTAGGTFTRTQQINMSTRGSVFAENSGGTFTDAVLTWNSDDYKKPIWAFGDSYFTIYTSTRWTHYVVQEWGYDTMLLNAYPGEASSTAYNDLLNALNHGTPKYLLWCMGMNDPDTSSAVNANWLSTIESIKTICANRGITLIMSTIPIVTNSGYRNDFKNQYVRESGYRYVDFAGAVDGVTGWLSDDGVHPSAIGGKVLASVVLADCPELLQG